MPLRIQKNFIATVAAVAIAITGLSAAPVRAGDNERAAALAAILGLALVGALVVDRKSDKKKKAKAKKKVEQYRSDRIYRTHPRPRTLPPRVTRKLLPQECLRSFRTDRGQARVFGQRCLNRHYDHVRSLPDKCHREFYTDRGWRQGFGARCLNRHGYQLARR